MGLTCTRCLRPLVGRQREVCSRRCRAALLRRQKAQAIAEREQAQAERDRELRGLLEAVVRLRHPRIEREGRGLLEEAMKLLGDPENRA